MMNFWLGQGAEVPGCHSERSSLPPTTGKQLNSWNLPGGRAFGYYFRTEKFTGSFFGGLGKVNL